MKSKIIMSFLVLSAFLGCRKDEIKPYNINDSAISFKAKSVSFTMRGMTQESMVAEIGVTLIGPKADFDREFSVKVVDNEDNTAVEGTDFKILRSVVKAGELSGVVEVQLNKFPEGVNSRRTTLEVVPGEHFREGYKGYMLANVIWSDGYVRPVSEVWRPWYRYFSKGYSRKMHEVIVECLGEEAEKSVDKRNVAESNPEFIFRLPTWWFSASRQLREYVEQYDKAHPGEPLMHSDDYEYYSSENVGVGNGKKPDKIPTILSTLLII